MKSVEIKTANITPLKLQQFIAISTSFNILQHLNQHYSNKEPLTTAKHIRNENFTNAAFGYQRQSCLKIAHTLYTINKKFWHLKHNALSMCQPVTTATYIGNENFTNAVFGQQQQSCQKISNTLYTINKNILHVKQNALSICSRIKKFGTHCTR